MRSRRWIVVVLAAAVGISGSTLLLRSSYQAAATGYSSEVFGGLVTVHTGPGTPSQLLLGGDSPFLTELGPITAYQSPPESGIPASVH